MKNVTQTDLELLQGILRPEDANESYVTANNQYGWYRGIAEFLQPRVIGEIGVHCGYSLWAMLTGAKRASCFGFDNESIVSGSMKYAHEHLPKASLWVVDTQTKDSVGENFCDLFHVDGDHTPNGCKHDIELGWKALRDGGVLLVDDVDYMGLRPIVEEFATQHTGWFYLPTFRGMGVIRKS